MILEILIARNLIKDFFYCSICAVGAPWARRITFREESVSRVMGLWDLPQFHYVGLSVLSRDVRAHSWSWTPDLQGGRCPLWRTYVNVNVKDHFLCRTLGILDVFFNLYQMLCFWSYIFSCWLFFFWLNVHQCLLLSWLDFVLVDFILLFCPNL